LDSGDNVSAGIGHGPSTEDGAVADASRRKTVGKGGSSDTVAGIRKSGSTSVESRIRVGTASNGEVGGEGEDVGSNQIEDGDVLGGESAVSAAISSSEGSDETSAARISITAIGDCQSGVGSAISDGGVSEGSNGGGGRASNGAVGNISETRRSGISESNQLNAEVSVSTSISGSPVSGDGRSTRGVGDGGVGAGNGCSVVAGISGSG